jgi:DNA-binding MarR family transcriptional regulator
VPSSQNVQNTHISAQLRRLHEAVLDIVGVMNRPQRDETLIREAGIPLDRALFPLLIGVERFGPIGVVELADGVGRDHTTVSRQVAKLEGLGLVHRKGSAADRRVREAIISQKGKAMVDLVGAARDRILGAIFEKWDAGEIDALVRLTRKFADAMKEDPPSGARGDDTHLRPPRRRAASKGRFIRSRRAPASYPDESN